MEDNPYIMIWNIASTTFSLKVTGGDSYDSNHALSPKIGDCINPGPPYGYVLFTKLNVDIYSGPNGSDEKLDSTTILIDRTGQYPYPIDTKNILQMAYDQAHSHYPPKPDPWAARNYFNITAPKLPIVKSAPPIITNIGWWNGQGNFDSAPIVGKNFWVTDFGDGRWSPDSRANVDSICQSTALDEGDPRPGSRAYPIHIDSGAPDWKVSFGVGAAKEGLWQIDVNLGSDGHAPYCETFYLSERRSADWGVDNYGDGGGKANYCSREIDILETRWAPTGPNLNLPNICGSGWNPDYNNKGAGGDWGIKQGYPKWSDIGWLPMKQWLSNEWPLPDFLTFGCLIRGDKLWLYAYKGRAYNWVQWYCTKPILKKSPYNQEHPFVPYIGTWTDIDQSRGGGFCTQYRNLDYLPPDDKQIKDKDPQTNP
ncbi:MAG: hypothetical protein WBW73_25515, partial [Rhodoplanes sp.]